MDEDFFLTDFSLEDIDFDFNVYEEINPSPDEATMDTQKVQVSSNFDHQMQLEYLGEKPKPPLIQTMKINNTPQVISFDLSSNVSVDEIIMDQLVGRGTKRKVSSSATRSPVLAKEHVIAERKRREKLSEKFIALSALLPGLKKMDKLTVLEDAISCMKQLQERIRKLDERKEMESVILVKKSIVFFDEEPSDHEKFDQTLPDIEAKVCQNEVLIRIHCNKSKACMINILNTIENLQLRIENSIVLPFGDSLLDITILAQMETDYSDSVLKDLVRKLRLTLV